MPKPLDDWDYAAFAVRLYFNLGVKAALLGSELVVSASVADGAVGWDFTVLLIFAAAVDAAFCDAELKAKFLAVIV